MRPMLVRDIGEFALIGRLSRLVGRHSGGQVEGLERAGFRLRLAIGDDAAAWDGPAGANVLTTDTMVEGVHFDLARISWEDLGWKAMSSNLSDIAAMGASPLYSVVTLGVRGDLPVDGLERMYRGMSEASARYGGAIAGGDTVRSPVLFVTVALVGFLPGGPTEAVILTRESARPWDRIAVTGALGCSAGGLRMLSEGLAFDRETARHLTVAHHRPCPRVAEGIELAGSGVRAAIDVSDGLVDDLGKLCRASGVGAAIHLDRVPADDFLKRAFPDECIEMALGGGEDYELLFTGPQAVVDRVVHALDIPVSIIGEVVPGPPRVTVLDGEGREVAVQRGGWDHFPET